MIRSTCAALLTLLATVALAPPTRAAAPGRRIPVTTRSAEALAAFERGRALADNLHRTDASTELRAALALDPHFALAHAWLGAVLPGARGLAELEAAARDAGSLPAPERTLIEHMLAHRKAEPRSLSLAQRLVELAPDDARAYEVLGQHQYSQGDLEAAVVNFHKATQLDPKAGYAWNELGYSLARLNRQGEAIEAFRRFAEAEPREPNARDSLGEALMALGRLDQAEAAFIKATQLSPAFYPGDEGVAYCRFYRGDFAGGREAMQKAIASAHSEDDKLDEQRILAWSWLAAGDLKAALGALAPLEKSSARSWQAAQDQGEMLIEAGRGPDGLEALALAAKRADQAGLSGNERLTVDREMLAFRVLAEASAHQLKEAQKTADRIAAIAQGNASSAWRSTAVLSRGALLLARGETAQAVKELAACVPEDALCRHELLRAQSLAGVPEAAQTRAALLREGRRGPLNLYVQASVSRALPRAAAKQR